MIEVLQRVVRPILPRLEMLLEGVPVVFRCVWLVDGSVTMMAPLPTQPADLRAVQRGAALSGGTMRITPCPPLVNNDAPPSWLAPCEPTWATPAAPVQGNADGPAERVPGPVWQATLRGWTEEDLAGTGLGGNYGDDGGRSVRTGLTAAEMALSEPPARWAALAGTVLPWEIDGWEPPGVNWTPPPTLDPAGDTETVPGSISDPEAYGKALASGKVVEALTADEEAALREYGPLLPAALDAIRTLQGDAEAPPSENKARYYLTRREELPTFTRAQYHAMLRTLEQGR